jgi:ribose-phosphate pyrophosphokinase
MGARSDRRFTEGDANYLKQVICPIINSQKFESVTILDPHSDVLEACLDNFEKIDNHDIVKSALTDIDNKNDAQDRIVLVSPDAGAQKKIFNVAQKFGIQKVITANKVRNVRTGEIVNTDVPSLTGNFCMDPGQKFVIVDDICDGGRTFIELAKAIRLQRPDAEIYLIVTHGIFSNSFYELSKHIKKVYSSNSYSDIDVEHHSDYTVGKDYLMQFNSF